MSPDATQIEGVKFLRLDQVLDVVPVSRATLYRMIDKEEFPSPCRFGSSSVWPFLEVREWAERVKRRRPSSPKVTREEEDFI